MSRSVLGLLALTLLGACGIKGDLERPDPMWNREDAIRRECERQLENNEQQDARCAQYQTGSQPQASLAPRHEIIVADIALVNVEQPQPPNRTAIPEIIEAPADAPDSQ